MGKITKSKKNTTAFGGLNFIYDAVSCAGMDKFINKQIGYRSNWVVYSYTDVCLAIPLCRALFSQRTDKNDVSYPKYQVCPDN